MGDSPRLLGIADRILASFSPLLSLGPEELDRVGVSVPIPIFNEEDPSEIVAQAPIHGENPPPNLSLKTILTMTEQQTMEEHSNERRYISTIAPNARSI
jgi:hypothetical protein